MASTQLDLFNEAKVEVREPEPMTEVRLGQRSARIPPPPAAEGGPDQADGNSCRAGGQGHLYQHA